MNEKVNLAVDEDKCYCLRSSVSEQCQHKTDGPPILLTTMFYMSNYACQNTMYVH